MAPYGSLHRNKGQCHDQYEKNQSTHVCVFLDAKINNMLERAASCEKMAVNRFTLSHAIAAAERIIEYHERIVLSGILSRGLHNPPVPNDALRCATRRGHVRIGG